MSLQLGEYGLCIMNVKPEITTNYINLSYL